jgi:predicted lipoprotein with Yx(FWY)xxD motif
MTTATRTLTGPARAIAFVAATAFLTAACSGNTSSPKRFTESDLNQPAPPATSRVTSSAPRTPPVVLKVGLLPKYPRALTDEAGRAVYTFTGDEHGNVTCLGACNQEWPPVLTNGNPTVIGTTFHIAFTQPRGDGTEQATYGGFPLYYYAGDTAPGQTHGRGRVADGGTWYLVQDNGNGNGIG